MENVSADQILSRLPARLKEARQRQGLSLDAVARLSGVSRSMVSQIERGESSPTVATLWNLTRALQVDFAGLLEGPKAPVITVVTAAQAPRIAGHGKGCQITILSPPEQAGQLEVYDIALDPCGALDSEPHGTGTREQLTVLTGRIEIHAGNESREMGPGDTAHYPADQPHCIKALDQPARVLLVVRA
ncbi:MAG: XRE family transcriptional regulator [Paracoccus sp. (in: a-proteobacteria)]|nr:XRE family transcriptional regulator [Paracoccus sp. (in: a-proteobacteria)]